MAVKYPERIILGGALGGLLGALIGEETSAAMGTALGTIIGLAASTEEFDLWVAETRAKRTSEIRTRASMRHLT